MFVSWFFISIHSGDGVSASMSKQGSFSNRNKELLHRLGKCCERKCLAELLYWSHFFSRDEKRCFLSASEPVLTSPTLVFSLEKNRIDKREACTYVLTKFGDTCTRCYFSCVYMQTPNSWQQWRQRLVAARTVMFKCKRFASRMFAFIDISPAGW